MKIPMVTNTITSICIHTSKVISKNWAIRRKNLIFRKTLKIVKICVFKWFVFGLDFSFYLRENVVWWWWKIINIYGRRERKIMKRIVLVLVVHEDFLTVNTLIFCVRKIKFGSCFDTNSNYNLKINKFNFIE